MKQYSPLQTKVAAFLLIWPLIVTAIGGFMYRYNFVTILLVLGFMYLISLYALWAGRNDG